MRRNSDAIAGSIAFVFWAYMMSVGIFALYYNWEFARSNGFVRWVLLGEVKSSAKALVWPYFVFRSRDEANTNSPTSTEIQTAPLTRKQIAEMEIKKSILAINYAQQGTYLLNSKPHQNLDDYPNLQEIIDYRRKAVETAKSVDTAVLNGVYPEFGDRFKNQFMEAMDQFVRGAQTTGPAASTALGRSQKLNNDWADWYQSNRVAIEEACNKAIGAN